MFGDVWSKPVTLTSLKDGIKAKAFDYVCLFFFWFNEVNSKDENRGKQKKKNSKNYLGFVKLQGMSTNFTRLLGNEYWRAVFHSLGQKTDTITGLFQ